MATLLRIVASARNGDSVSVTADPNGNGQRKVSRQDVYTLVYDAVVDAMAAANAAGLPIVGWVYDGLFCSRVNPARSRDNPRVWTVTVDMENAQPPQTTGDSKIWNLSIRKSVASREEQATRDRLNLPLVNTFGNLLPQLPNNTLYDEVFAITWSTSVAPDWGDLDGKVNSDAFSFTICGITRSYLKSQVKVTSSSFSSTKIITATTGGTPTFSFIYEAELVIQCRKPKWVWNAPNEGFDGILASNMRGQFADPLGNPKTAPTALDLLAKAVPAGGQILKLPDAAIDQSTPLAGRTYAADGAFELDLQAALSPLISTLRD